MPDTNTSTLTTKDWKRVYALIEKDYRALKAMAARYVKLRETVYQGMGRGFGRSSARTMWVAKDIIALAGTIRDALKMMEEDIRLSEEFSDRLS